MILKCCEILQSVYTAIRHKQYLNFEGVMCNPEANQHEAAEAQAQVLDGIQDAVNFSAKV